MLKHFLTLSLLISALLCNFCIAKSTKWGPSDYKLDNTSSIANTNDMYAGYMPLSLKEEKNNEGAFFFWLVKQNKGHVEVDGEENSKGGTKKPKQLLIWLNGGPGCTSLLGLIMENGPFTVVDSAKADGTFTFLRNKYSWSEEADVLYVEQPVRTGFSLAATDSRPIKKEKDVARDFGKFLKSFMEVFPDYQQKPLFISGESYAGFYIPWIAEHLLQLKQSDNEAERASVVNINLQGVAIGNGAIDYAIQEPSYAEYAYYHGLIPLESRERLEEEWARCVDSFQDRSSNRAVTVGDYDECDLMGKTLAASGHPNEYNVETYHSYGELLFGDSTFMRFFNDPVIQKWLHVRGGSAESPLPGLNFHIAEDEGILEEQVFVPAGWQACSDRISEDMKNDHPTSSVPAIRFVSNHIRVMLYNGEFDLNCNFLGTQHTLERNLWGRNRDMAWKEAKRSLWMVDGDGAGLHYQLGNLSFLVVKGAGHLLPMDKPKESLDMITRFMSGGSFGDRELPAGVEYTAVSLPKESIIIGRGVGTGGGASVALLPLCAVLLAVLWVARDRRMKQHLGETNQTLSYTDTRKSSPGTGYQQSFNYEKVNDNE